MRKPDSRLARFATPAMRREARDFLAGYPDERGPMSQYVSEDRCTLVRTWEDETAAGELDGAIVVEVATRPDTDAVWGPPVRVLKER
jgi:hypothetical protein